MIEIRQLEFAFIKGKPIFSGVDLIIERGEFVVIKGPSGSGKTTLINIMQMDLLPDSGVVSIAGYSSNRIAKKVIPSFRRCLGVVRQDFRLVNNITVYENVALSLKVRGTPKKQIKERVFKILADVGISHAAHLHPEEISGGEKQRTAIARAIIGNPQLLLADEPAALLDDRAGAEIFELINKINSGGTTVVLASHIRSPFLKPSCRVVEIVDGNLEPLKSG